MGISNIMTYHSSRVTSSKIMKAYESLHYVLLAAPPQSGKTSVYLDVAKQGMGDKWDKVILLCNMGDNALKEQTRMRFKDAGIDAEIMFRGEITGTTKMSAMALLRRYAGRVLIIVDESHIGASRDQGIDTFFRKMGVAANGDYDNNLYTESRVNVKRPYILSVSATPYAEASVVDTNRKDIIFHKPGDGYIGQGWYLTNNRVHNIPTDWQPVLKDAIKRARRRMPRSYAIIRWGAVSDRNHNDIGDIVKSITDSTIEYDQEYTAKGCLLDSIVSVEPKKFTVILIKNHCSAGQTFSKKYISMVWETRAGADAQVQGLPGRCCGYMREEDIRNLEIWCDRESLRANNKLYQRIYDKVDIASSIPTSGANIKASIGGRKYIHDPRYVTIREYNTYEEVRDSMAKMRDYFVKNPIFQKQQGWWDRTPKFGLRKDGRWVSTEEAENEDGFVVQYLRVHNDPRLNTKVWGRDELLRHLNMVAPQNSKDTGFRYNGMEWRTCKVAKIAYRDLNDPSSRVYIMYSYNGPVREISSSEKCGTATDKSIYVHGIGASSYHKVAKVILIPDNNDEATVIRSYKDMILTADDPTVFAYESEGGSQLVSDLMIECANEALDNLRWAGRCTPSLSFLQQYIDKRIMSMERIEFTSQGDEIRYLLKLMGATSPETALTPLEVRDKAMKMGHNWTWKTTINGAVSRFGDRGVISRIVYQDEKRYYL